MVETSTYYGTFQTMSYKNVENKFSYLLIFFFFTPPKRQNGWFCFTHVYHVPTTYFESNLTQIQNLSRSKVENDEETITLQVSSSYLRDGP